jgi:hypothetical protein
MSIITKLVARRCPVLACRTLTREFCEGCGKCWRCCKGHCPVPGAGEKGRP